MPLRDLGEPPKYTDVGAAFFAVDEESLARVMISIDAFVLAYYREADRALERADFRALMVDVAARRYDAAEIKDGYVIIDAELLELSA